MTISIPRNSLDQPVGHSVLDWQPCERPADTPMQGRYCSLVRTDVLAHGEALFEAFARDTEHGNWTYLPYGPFDNVHDFADWLSGASASADPLFHTILDARRQPVGLASYLRLEPRVGTIEVGHLHFSPLMQRTPVATEAMYLMMERVFDELGYRRYEWKCDALNAPSCAAALRFGFVPEGIFRQATVYKNRNRDTAWYSIIDSEWPAIKRMMQTWLSPENFDQQGKQLRRLSSCRDMLLA